MSSKAKSISWASPFNIYVFLLKNFTPHSRVGNHSYRNTFCAKPRLVYCTVVYTQHYLVGATNADTTSTAPAQLFPVGAVISSTSHMSAVCILKPRLFGIHSVPV
jgi:hypothetical protein